MRHTLIFILVLIISCKNKNVNNEKKFDKIDTEKAVINSSKNVNEKYDYQDTLFLLLKDYPKIKDTSEFVRELKSNCHLYVEGIFPKYGDTILKETVNSYIKTKLFGSSSDYYIIEYDWHGNIPNTMFPWKRQIVFDKSGKLVRIFSAVHFEPKQILANEYRFLLSVTSTAHGNGGHEFLRINSDTLENVFDGLDDNNSLETYDADHDNIINEPYELRFSAFDANKDGYNDIVLTGKIVLIQGRTKSGEWYDNLSENGKIVTSYSEKNPFKKISVRLVFLYNSKSGHFDQQEDYSKKYKFLQ